MKIIFSYTLLKGLKLQKKQIKLLTVVLFLVVGVQAQQYSPKIYQGIELSEVVVQDIRNGFDIDAFIQMVQRDTTYYKAFKSLHLLSFTLYNDIRFYNKNKKIIASYNSVSRQFRKSNCRSMKTEREKVTGNFYSKKGNYNYYTADLYDKLFFIKKPICNENNLVNLGLASSDNKRISQLKELIFIPGQEIHGVPGVGRKVGIFEKDMRSKYRFELLKKEFNKQDCYVFKAIPKKEYQKEVVINNLETWFSVQDGRILARIYDLSYRTLIYDFSVHMEVKLKRVTKYLVPYEVRYKGNWKIAGKQRERADFTAIFSDFH